MAWRCKSRGPFLGSSFCQIRLAYFIYGFVMFLFNLKPANPRFNGHHELYADP